MAAASSSASSRDSDDEWNEPAEVWEHLVARELVQKQIRDDGSTRTGIVEKIIDVENLTLYDVLMNISTNEPLSEKIKMSGTESSTYTFYRSQYLYSPKILPTENSLFIYVGQDNMPEIRLSEKSDLERNKKYLERIQILCIAHVNVPQIPGGHGGEYRILIPNFNKVIFEQRKSEVYDNLIKFDEYGPTHGRYGISFFYSYGPGPNNLRIEFNSTYKNAMRPHRRVTYPLDYEVGVPEGIEDLKQYKQKIFEALLRNIESLPLGLKLAILDYKRKIDRLIVSDRKYLTKTEKMYRSLAGIEYDDDEEVETFSIFAIPLPESDYSSASGESLKQMIKRNNALRNNLKRKSELTSEELVKLNKIFGKVSDIDEITDGNKLLLVNTNMPQMYTDTKIANIPLLNILRTDQLKLLLDIATHTDYKELKKEVEILREIVKECCPEIYNKMIIKNNTDLPEEESAAAVSNMDKVPSGRTKHLTKRNKKLKRKQSRKHSY